MPGAKPVGTTAVADFQQGQCLEMTLTMSPGKCYSVIATAAPSVQDLELTLATTMALSRAMAADGSVGPTAVIGAAPDCFEWALPTAGTMKVIVFVPVGHGVVAAQVFEK
jgi:hypothetical protein